MSLKTKLLELFKYEPDKDGAQTFNIKSALNDNWDKIEAWAQSVKTALTKLVPMSRTVNGKALSADVTLTGDDIAMGADDAESLRAAMAKRLMANGNVMRQGFIGSTVDDMYFASVTGTQNGGFLECYKDYARRTQFVISPPTDNTPLHAWISQTADGAHWTSKKLATCETPEVHELPLVNGATAEKSCVYYKTQENLVIGKLSLQASAAAYQEIPVAVLPEGFRPPQDFPFIVASCARKGVTWEGTGWGRIAPDGTIFVYQNITWGWVEAQFSFIAAN